MSLKNIADGLVALGEKVQHLFDSGKKAEHDRFWDAYQQKGSLTVCDCAFAGRGWTNESFKPKYKLTPTSAYMMFRYSEITEDVSQWVDLSKSTNNAYCFYGTKLKSIQADFSSATGLVSTFGYTAENETISIKLSNAGVKLTDCFTSMKGLKNLTVEGVIAEGNINISASTLLTAESAKSLITALKNYSGTDNAYKYKVTFSSSTKILLEAEGATAPNGVTWLEYARDIKGWNI